MIRRKNFTSCKMSACAIAANTVFLLESCTSPPRINSSKMKCAFSKLNIMSSSQTCREIHELNIKHVSNYLNSSNYVCLPDRKICSDLPTAASKYSSSRQGQIRRGWARGTAGLRRPTWLLLGSIQLRQELLSDAQCAEGPILNSKQFLTHSAHGGTTSQ
jgi:hypothetical protein